MRQYTLAADKYELLLRHFPLDRQGTLGYARLLTYSMFDYERAERILGEYTGEFEVAPPIRRFLPRDGFRDADILLARGDNFLEWAEEKPEHYERRPAAVRLHPRLLRGAGRGAAAHDALLHPGFAPKVAAERDPGPVSDCWKPRTGTTASRWTASSSPRCIPSWPASGWTSKQYDDVHDALLAAMKRDKFYPDAHYQLARYFRYLKDDTEEKKALNNAIQLLQDSSPFTRRRLLALIDSYDRLGEWHWRAGEYLDAEKNYDQADPAHRVRTEPEDPGPRLRSWACPTRTRGISTITSAAT